MSKYNTIKGLEAWEPVAACVTIGIKSNRGFPTETDRWHIVSAREEAGVKKPHPAFVAFNGGDPESRKILRGNVIHPNQDDCFEYHLKAQVLHRAHPNRHPGCVGDGVNAERWSGQDTEDFITMKCANESCEFRMKKPPMCKPFMRFLFRLRWEDGGDLATPLVKFTSGSWRTSANFKGFFYYLANVAAELGLKQYTLFGFPFMLTLQYQTKPSEKTKFPVVSISPEMDPIEFFLGQREKIKQLAQDVPIAITYANEQAPEVVFEDVKTISVPSQLPKQEDIIPEEVTVTEPFADPDRLTALKNELGTMTKSIHAGKVTVLEDWLKNKGIIEPEESLSALTVERLDGVVDMTAIALDAEAENNKE